MPKKIDTAGLKHFKGKENAMIAGKSESTNTATVAHAVGEYFYWKGVLHIVTAAIAVGGTIQTNTNVKPAVLADDVSVLKESFTYFLGDNDSFITLASNLNTGYVNYSNGTISAGDGTWKYTDFIPVNSNEKYDVLSYGHYLVASVAFYDETQTYISGIAGTNQNRWVDQTFSPVANAKYMRVTFHTADATIPNSENQHLEWIKILPDIDDIMTAEAKDYPLALQETARANVNSIDGAVAHMMDESKYHFYNYDTNFLYTNSPFATGFIALSNGFVTGHDGTWYNSPFFKINSDSTIKYRLSGHPSVASIAFYDENKNYISGIAAQSNTESGRDISSDNVEIPTNAVYLRYTMYCGNDFADRRTKQFIKFYRVPEQEEKKHISILFIGNSLTLDSISYLPYILYHYYPEIDFHIYSWHNAGYTLAQQYQCFVDDNDCTIFSVAENSPSWTKTTIKMSTLLSTYKFDVVSMQDYFSYREATPSDCVADWNNCQGYIQSHYTGGNALKFISLIPQPLRTNADAKMTLTLNVYKAFMQETICEDVIAAGLAVYNALSTSLDELGDLGHLSSDNLHTQEGLPCLLQTFTVLLWLFEAMGINKSVYGSTVRITSAVQSSIGVPDPQTGTGVIVGTDAQNILAQEVAIKSFKQCKKFVIDNLIAST